MSTRPARTRVPSAKAKAAKATPVKVEKTAATPKKASTAGTPKPTPAYVTIVFPQLLPLSLILQCERRPWTLDCQEAFDVCVSLF